MSESKFQSGEWTGFYTYQGRTRRHRMNLAMEFSKGRITGEGRDDVGDFVITGRYDADTGECSWSKVYVGMHSVYYEGFGENKAIWGTWSIDCTGGFHIWPIGESEGFAEVEKKEEPVSQMTVTEGNGKGCI